MKKIFTLLSLSTIAVSALFSCANNPSPTIITHTVVFNTNGGSEIASQTVKDGDPASRPDPSPRKSGCTFIDWYANPDLSGESYNFNEPVIKDLTLYAKWEVKLSCIVTFISNGGTDVDPQTVKPGGKAVEPDPAPTKTDYDFLGWFDNKELIGDAFDFNTLINDDLTLYAKWQKSYLTVTFDSKGGTDVDPQMIKNGDKAVEPDPAPTKPGYGKPIWRDVNQKEFKFDTTQITEDITLYADWGERTHYFVTWNFTDCYLYDSTGSTKITENPLKLAANATQTYLVKPKTEGYGIDLESDSESISFDENSKILTVTKIQKDIQITAKEFRISPLESLSWEQIKEISLKGEASTKFQIGDEKSITVNGSVHHVRIIGFNEDVDASDNPLGITFEFSDLLSDESGYSLTTYWNDVASTSAANNDYLSSSIRAALNGNDYDGSSKADINWFQFFGKTHDADTNREFSSAYNDKSVLSMLPSDLLSVMATPKKYIRVKQEGTWTDVTVDDQLFLLSPREVGYNAAQQESSLHTKTYSYYAGHTAMVDPFRLKQQVKGSTNARDDILDKLASGKYTSTKYSSAGFYRNTDGAAAGYIWLRSPNYSNSSNSYGWVISNTGLINNAGRFVCNQALGIAPAFCI